MTVRFRARGAFVEAAGPEVWTWLAARVSRLWRAEAELNAHLSEPLLDFVNAAEQAAQNLAARPVSPPKPALPAAVRVEEIGTREAAERMQCSRQYVCRLASEGRLTARQVGRIWLIDAASIDRDTPKAG